MPELLEVEFYRRLAVIAVGRRVVSVAAPDPWYLKAGLSAGALKDVLSGRTLGAADRHGKRLLLRFDAPNHDPGDVVLGLHFGMTGRLVVDGRAAIDRLEYSSARADPAWERFRLGFDDGGELVMIDPRRLGGVQLDPDPRSLGPDAATVRASVFSALLAASRRPLKAVLLDQSRLAGLGNLLVDEILWRARLSPTRPASGLDQASCTRLHRTVRTTLAALDELGGSHTGKLFSARSPGGCCPRCGAALRREQVGGRTTFWCPAEQR
ncbi:MAG: Fpg/Nei family DNA glycosylase [Acidimicrobiales bacterium]